MPPGAGIMGWEPLPNPVSPGLADEMDISAPQKPTPPLLSYSMQGPDHDIASFLSQPDLHALLCTSRRARAAFEHNVSTLRLRLPSCLDVLRPGPKMQRPPSPHHTQGNRGSKQVASQQPPPDPQLTSALGGLLVHSPSLHQLSLSPSRPLHPSITTRLLLLGAGGGVKQSWSRPLVEVLRGGGLCQLRVLHLCVGMGRADGAALFDALGEGCCPRLRELVVGEGVRSAGVGEGDVAALAAALRRRAGVRHIQQWGEEGQGWNSALDKGCKRVPLAPPLRRLDLTWAWPLTAASASTSTSGARELQGLLHRETLGGGAGEEGIQQLRLHLFCVPLQIAQAQQDGQGQGQGQEGEARSRWQLSQALGSCLSSLPPSLHTLHLRTTVCQPQPQPDPERQDEAPLLPPSSPSTSATTLLPVLITPPLHLSPSSAPLPHHSPPTGLLPLGPLSLLHAQTLAEGVAHRQLWARLVDLDLSCLMLPSDAAAVLTQAMSQSPCRLSSLRRLSLHTDGGGLAMLSKVWLDWPQGAHPHAALMHRDAPLSRLEELCLTLHGDDWGSGMASLGVALTPSFPLCHSLRALRLAAPLVEAHNRCSATLAWALGNHGCGGLVSLRLDGVVENGEAGVAALLTALREGSSAGLEEIWLPQVLLGTQGLAGRAAVRLLEAGEEGACRGLKRLVVGEGVVAAAAWEERRRLVAAAERRHVRLI